VFPGPNISVLIFSYEWVSIIAGTGAAICSAFVVALCNSIRWNQHILKVIAQNFTQLSESADFYVLLFGIVYLA
jgi:hypothetical protein